MKLQNKKYSTNTILLALLTCGHLLNAAAGEIRPHGQLRDAIIAGDLAKVQELRESGAVSKDGRFAGITTDGPTQQLTLALMYNRLNVIEYLLNDGTDSSKTYFPGDNPPLLHFIASQPAKTPQLIELFVAHAENINVTNQQGETALHLLINQDRNNNTLKIFLDAAQKAGKVVNVNATSNQCYPGDYQNTPLLTAINSNNPEAVRLLMEHGADITIGAHDYMSPLYAATYERDTAVLDALLSNHRSPQVATILAAKDNDGNSVLHKMRTRRHPTMTLEQREEHQKKYALLEKRYDDVLQNIIIEMGINPTQSRAASLEKMQALLDAGCDANYASDFDGIRLPHVLFQAMICQVPEAVDLLIRYGARTDIPITAQGKTALQVAQELAPAGTTQDSTSGKILSTIQAAEERRIQKNQRPPVSAQPTPSPPIQTPVLPKPGSPTQNRTPTSPTQEQNQDSTSTPSQKTDATILLRLAYASGLTLSGLKLYTAFNNEVEKITQRNEKIATGTSLKKPIPEAEIGATARRKVVKKHKFALTYCVLSLLSGAFDVWTHVVQS